MGIYFVLLFVLLFNIFFESEFNNIKIFNYRIRSRNISFFVCFLIILSLGILRDEELGVDVANYKNYFSVIYPNLNIKYFLMDVNYDLGYIILNKFVGIFTDNFRIFEIVTYCLNFCIFSIIIYRESRYPALSFLIYVGLEFIGFNMCILRQSLACSLCFLAYYCLEKNKKLNYFLFVILAISFHKTAIFFTLTYLLSYNRKEFPSHLRNFIITVLFFVGFNYLLPNVYGIYRNDYSNAVVKGQGGKLLLFYIISLLLINVILYRHKLKEEIMKYESSFGAVYMQMGALSFALFTRVTKYFSILFTLSIPNIVYYSKNRKFYILIYTAMFSLLYIYGLYSNELKIVPYKSFMSI